MKTSAVILFTLMLSTALLNSQTIEDRITILEKHKVKVDSVFGWSDPVIIPDDTLKQPTFEGITYSNPNLDCVIYNPAFIFKGKWTTYLNKGGVIYMISSDNGLNNWNLTQTTGAPYGSIIQQNNFKGSAHKWFGGIAYSYTYGSLDGINWSATSVDWSQTIGEDRNLLYDNGIYRCYIRLRPIPRTIGYQESSTFVGGWSRTVEILKPDLSEVNKQFYQMSVIKTDRGYFGLLTVYRVGDNGQDVGQLPPYSPDEHTSDLQLTYSADGKTNWIRLNGKKNFLNRRAEIKQMFGWWSVIGGTAYIYTAESKRRHTDWENAYNTAGNRYYACRYKIELDELYKYID